MAALASATGVQMGLATGNFRESAFIKLRRYGLDSYFREGGFGGDHPERPAVVADAIEKCQAISGKLGPTYVYQDLSDTEKVLSALLG